MYPKILIVENEYIISQDIQSSLESMNFEVVLTASTGMEAIQKAKNLKPDLILMDIMLEGEMDGIEAAEKIKAIFDVPIIYVTAYGDEETLKRAKLTEPHGFIIKPISHDELRASVETALYKHELDKKLKESEARFRSVYENSFDAILLTKPDGTVLAANHAAEDMFLMSEEEIIKAGRDGLVVNDNRLKSALKERNRTGKARAELMHKRKDGSTFLGEVTSNIFTDVDSSIKTSMIIRDLTGRKEAEDELKQARDNLEEKVQERTSELEKYYESLKESETKFRELFNKALDTIALTEIQENMLPGHFIEVNEAVIQKSGYTKEELMNMTPLDLFTPNSQDEILKSASELQKKGYATFEATYIVKDGKQIPAEVNVHIFKLGGKDVALAIARDITERKKAEAALKESELKFRKLFNQATDMLSLTELSDDGTIKNYIEVNQAISKRLGYTKNELLNMSPLDLYLDKSSILRMVPELFEKGSSFAENIQIAKDGRQIPVELNTTLFKLRGKKYCPLNFS